MNVVRFLNTRTVLPSELALSELVKDRDFATLAEIAVTYTDQVRKYGLDIVDFNSASFLLDLLEKTGEATSSGIAIDMALSIGDVLKNRRFVTWAGSEEDCSSAQRSLALFVSRNFSRIRGLERQLKAQEFVSDVKQFFGPSENPSTALRPWMRGFLSRSKNSALKAEL